MSNTDQLSRRALLGASSIGMAGVVGAAAFMSTRAQAVTASSFVYKSINDFGALTTNSASANSAAIQNALNSLSSYDCLVFPPGTYNILTGLTISGSRKHIQLLGPGATLMVTGVGTNTNVLNITGSSETSNIESLSITGLTINSTVIPPIATSGIVLNYALRVSMCDVSIFNMAQYCLSATNAWWLSTHNCVFGTAGTASVYQGTNMNAVTHIASRFAPILSAASSPRGIIHDGGGAAVSFIGCDFTNALVGAEVLVGSNITFSGCYFEDVATAISLGSWPNNWLVTNTTIENCYISLTNKITQVVGVDISYVRYVSVQHNNIRAPNASTTAFINYANNANDRSQFNKGVLIKANLCIDAANGGNEVSSIVKYSYTPPGGVQTNYVSTYNTTAV